MVRRSVLVVAVGFAVCLTAATSGAVPACKAGEELVGDKCADQPLQGGDERAWRQARSVRSVPLGTMSTNALSASHRAPLFRGLRRAFVRLLRALRRAVREPSPVVDRLQPEKRDRFGFGPIVPR